MDRVLTQSEIDNAFNAAHEHDAAPLPLEEAQPYNFCRTDRIAKDQIRTIHLLHENFARSMASSLSAYLRSYVVVNLISVEQLAFVEFTQSLPSPTCIVAMSMKPYDSSAVLEMNPSLVFPLLEMLLGGSAKAPKKMDREITEIEQSILDGLLRVILHDLESAWTAIAPMQFTIDNHETEPQLLQVLAQNEAVVAISIEIRIGENSGMMNLGIPSILVKMLRQKFDHLRTVRKAQSSDEEHARVLRLIRPAAMHLDARLEGPTVPMKTLLDLQSGDVLVFDHPVHRPIDLWVNGKLKYERAVVASGSKRALEIGRLT
jgi:flagellar motor switch protein FliM